MVLRSALRAAKDVRIPVILSVAVVWTCIPTAAFFLGRLAGLGSAGGWIGFVAETTVGAVLMAWRWRRGAWRLAY
jgi:Na+-driven multidrug efflux pump